MAVRAHGFVLGAEHRHRHGGHQDRTLAIVQLSRTPGERSALGEGEEERRRMRERSGDTKVRHHARRVNHHVW